MTCLNQDDLICRDETNATSWTILGKSSENDKVQKGRLIGDFGRHEREAYVEVRPTIIQSTITRQVESMDSGEQVSHRQHC